MERPSISDLMEMDWVKCRAIHYSAIMEGEIFRDGNKLVLLHNNSSADNFGQKERGYTCGLLLHDWINEPQNLRYIHSFKILEEPKKKSTRYTYSTTKTRSDGVVFTKDTIDWDTIPALEAEMAKYRMQANEIHALLTAHKNLKFNK
jgi:hypothetical protein